MFVPSYFTFSRYVLPNHMLLQIAEILPREMQGVLACCNPIPPLVRANLLEIHKIILKARDQSLIKPILQEAPRSLGAAQTVVRLNVENVLNCPHDMSHVKEVHDDLPTLLGDKLKLKQSVETTKTVQIEKSKPIFDVFEKIDESLKLLKREASKKVKKFKFLGPYERYKLVKPFIQAEEEKIEELKEKELERVVMESKNTLTIEDKNKSEKISDKERISRVSTIFQHEFKWPNFFLFSVFTLLCFLSIIIA